MPQESQESHGNEKAIRRSTSSRVATHSSIHELIYPRTHLSTHSPIHTLIYPHTNLSTNSSIHELIYPEPRSTSSSLATQQVPTFSLCATHPAVCLCHLYPTESRTCPLRLPQIEWPQSLSDSVATSEDQVLLVQK